MACLKCFEPIADSQFCECDGCKQKIHYTCSDLSTTELRCMTLKNRYLKYLCHACQEGLRLVPLLKTKIDELENKFNQLIKDSNSKSSSNCNSTSTDSNFHLESLLIEIEERKTRAKNIMIYNLPESQTDDAKVKEIVSTVSDADKVKKIFRVGKTGDRPRPIKVILSDSDTAIQILKNRSRINNPQISVRSDLTTVQRDYLKELRDQLNQRIADGEANLTIKYVRGIPKIVAKETQKNM